MRAQAHAEAEEVLAAAAEQTAWAKRTVEELLAAANADAERIRTDAHAEARSTWPRCGPRPSR